MCLGRVACCKANNNLLIYWLFFRPGSRFLNSLLICYILCYLAWSPFTISSIVHCFCIRANCILLWAYLQLRPSDAEFVLWRFACKTLLLPWSIFLGASSGVVALLFNSFMFFIDWALMEQVCIVSCFLFNTQHYWDKEHSEFPSWIVLAFVLRAVPRDNF